MNSYSRGRVNGYCFRYCSLLAAAKVLRLDHCPRDCDADIVAATGLSVIVRTDFLWVDGAGHVIHVGTKDLPMLLQFCYDSGSGSVTLPNFRGPEETT